MEQPPSTDVASSGDPGSGAGGGDRTVRIELSWESAVRAVVVVVAAIVVMRLIGRLGNLLGQLGLSLFFALAI